MTVHPKSSATMTVVTGPVMGIAMAAIAVAVTVRIATVIAVGRSVIGSISAIAIGIRGAMMAVTAGRRGSRDNQLCAGDEAHHRQRSNASLQGLLPCHVLNIARIRASYRFERSQPKEQSLP